MAVRIRRKPEPGAQPATGQQPADWDTRRDERDQLTVYQVPTAKVAKARGARRRRR